MAAPDDADLWLADISAAFENFDSGDGSAASTARSQEAATRVPRVPYGAVTSEEFARLYSATNTPVILGDAFGPDGPVPQHLTVAFFKQNFRDALVPLDYRTPTERVVKLGEFLDFADTEMNKGYCRSLHTFEWFPDINAELCFPDKLVNPTNYLAAPPLPGCDEYPEAWSRWFELFINNRECAGFPFLHRDMCATHAFSMQVQGIKRFILFPPSDSEYLYPFGATGTRSSIPHDDICAFKVDTKKFPLYPQASLHIADLRPGDVFFCPSDWWHTTKALSAEPSVTFGGNYVDESNKDAFAGCWREYVAARKLAASGITRIENGGL